MKGKLLWILLHIDFIGISSSIDTTLNNEQYFQVNVMCDGNQKWACGR